MPETETYEPIYIEFIWALHGEQNLGNKLEGVIRDLREHADRWECWLDEHPDYKDLTVAEAEGRGFIQRPPKKD